MDGRTAGAPTTMRSPPQAIVVARSTISTVPVTAEDGPLPAIVPMDDAGAAAIEAPGFADWVAVGTTATWVANVGGGIRRYELATGAELGTTPLGVVCLAMDITEDSLWAGDCDANRVVRIDVDSGEVIAAIDPGFEPLAEESSIAATADAVYVLSSRFPRQVASIDPVTNEVANTFAAPSEAAAVRAGFDSLWFTVPRTGRLVQVDPGDGTEISAADVGGGARFLAVGDDSVWILAADDAVVTRVSPTGEVLARIRVGDAPVEGGDIAVGGGSVWARVSDSTVVRIDETSGEIVARYGEPSGSGGVAADDDAAWISAHDRSTVWRLPLS